MVSKDTIRKVVGAWYGFSEPLSEESNSVNQKNSLFNTVKRLNESDVRQIRKEG